MPYYRKFRIMVPLIYKRIGRLSKSIIIKVFNSEDGGPPGGKYRGIGLMVPLI